MAITGAPKPWNELTEAERQAYRNEYPGNCCCIVRMEPHQLFSFLSMRSPNWIARDEQTARLFAIPTDAVIVASKIDSDSGTLLVKMTHPTFAFVSLGELIPTATLCPITSATLPTGQGR